MHSKNRRLGESRDDFEARRESEYDGSTLMVGHCIIWAIMFAWGVAVGAFFF